MIFSKKDISEENKIAKTFEDFGVKVELLEINIGPTFKQYIFEVPEDTKEEDILSIQKEIEIAITPPSGSVRIEYPMQDTNNITIEISNEKREYPSYSEHFEELKAESNKPNLKIPIGVDSKNKLKFYDIALMPHMLITGATGSGKSQFIHNIITSLIATNNVDDIKLVLIDPKRVELGIYNNIPQLLTPIILDPDEAVHALKWAIEEMKRRFEILETAMCRNTKTYNEKVGYTQLPPIVIIFDEFVDVMMFDPVGVEKSVVRLAQLAKAVDINIILSTSRASAMTYTGLIKANVPCRAAFNVTSPVDSFVIIDQPGAEKLLGKGDMLFVPPDTAKPQRLQALSIDDSYIGTLIEPYKVLNTELKTLPFVRTQKEIKENEESEMYQNAFDAVVSEGKASASLLQRKLSIGYARASRLLDELEANGIIGPAEGSNPRDVLILSNDNNLEDKFPWKDVEACFKNKESAAKRYYSDKTVDEMCETYKDLKCPKCDKKIDDLEIFYFVSPKWTWEELCGRSGWMIACKDCKKQLAFELGVMN